jgi:hypothetical protein
MPYGLPHPEAQEGEVWLANVPVSHQERYTFQTQRFGHTAYDVGDRIMGPEQQPRGHFVPMFVQRWELIAMGIPAPDQTGKTLGRVLGEIDDTLRKIRDTGDQIDIKQELTDAALKRIDDGLA